MKASRERILQEAGESLKAFRVERTVFDGPFHFHPELELTWIEEGTGIRLLGDDVGSFSRGDLCLIGSNLPHVYRSETNLGNRSAARATVIQFSPDEGLGLLAQLPELSFLPALCRRAAQGLVFDPAQAAGLGPLIHNLPDLSGWARLRGFLDVLAQLAMLGGRIAASSGYVLIPESTPSDSVSRACEIILTNFRESISHTRLAAAAGLSPSAFSRLFKKTTRLNFSQFLNRVRLGHASRLLQETDRGITAIAFESGFENLSNFNRRFRERYGSSPKAYRALVRSNRVSK
jgi:AraC-like DNA-binding protein